MLYSFWSSTLITHAALRFVVGGGVGYGFVQRASQSQRRGQVDRGHFQQFRVAEILRGVFVEARCAIYNAIQRAERLDTRRHEPRNLRFDAQIRPQRDGATSERDDVSDGFMRFPLRFAVVHGDVPAARRKTERDAPADAFRRAGDEHDARPRG